MSNATISSCGKDTFRSTIFDKNKPQWRVSKHLTSSPNKEEVQLFSSFCLSVFGLKLDRGLDEGSEVTLDCGFS